MFMCISWIALLISLFQKQLATAWSPKTACMSRTNGTKQCGNLTCYNEAKCKDGKCMCKVGYTGRTCFDDLDECELGDPCLHRGHCHNNIGSYRCACLDGWSGEDFHCATKVNSTTWKCTPGWLGEKCQDKCLNNSMCHNRNEICSRYGRGFQCMCAPGWFGQNCMTDKDECKDNPCPKNANCKNSPGSYECLCVSGWKGDNCDTDINECQNNPCQHNSTCTNEQGYYICSCTKGWNGDNCDKDIDECLDNPCQHNSTCTNAQGFYNCICSKGWKGVNCSEDIDECNFNACSPRRSCKNTVGSFECRCYQGLQGASCDVDIDECKLSPCYNNGTCINTFGFYKCNCSSGWQGCYCNIDINECENSPCNTTTVCRNRPGTFTCIRKQTMSDISDADRTYAIVGTALISVLFGVSVAAFIWIMKLMCDKIYGKTTINAKKPMLKQTWHKVHNKRNDKQEHKTHQQNRLQQQQNLQLHLHLHPQQKVLNKPEELQKGPCELHEYLDDVEQQDQHNYRDRGVSQHIQIRQPSQLEQPQQREDHQNMYWLRKIKRYFKHIQNPLWRY